MNGISFRLTGTPATSIQRIFPLVHFYSSLIKVKILGIISYAKGQKYLSSWDPTQGPSTYSAEVLGKPVIASSCCNLQQNSKASEEEMQHGE